MPRVAVGTRLLECVEYQTYVVTHSHTAVADLQLNFF